MSEANKALAKRFFEEVWNKSRRSAIAELLAPNAVIYESGEVILGHDGFQQSFDRMQATFSDIHVSFNDVIAEADKVCLRWSVSMRHTGNGFGVPPTGKTLHTTGTTVVRIANGQFLEGWQNWDMLGLMAQMRGEGLGRLTLWRIQFRIVGWRLAIRVLSNHPRIL
jgi:predicted ester cyclase